MDLGLKGKIAVVTGSTAGIGFAIANTLAAEGAQVTVNGRTQVRVDSAIDKITKVARKVYGADAIELSELAQKNLDRFRRWGFGELPICIAKTQYSLSDDPKVVGAPTGWTLHVTDIALSAGAGFLVVISGSMMLMPGLPKVSRALEIDVDDQGEIIGME